MITLGVDVSKWNGIINFDILKNNTQFVIIKATEGSSYVDTAFKLNQLNARKSGLLTGYYHFARPDLGNTPESEAAHFLNTIGQPLPGELFCLDYECANQIQSHVEWCRLFMQRVQERLKLKCLIYLNQAIISKFDWSSVVAGGYGLWIAAYTGSPTNNIFNAGEFKVAAMQQWTSSQTVPGMPGATDGNVFFGSLETLKKYGYQPVVVPPVTPPSDSQTIIDLKNQIITLNKTIESMKIAHTQALAQSALDSQNKLTSLKSAIIAFVNSQ